MATKRIAAANFDLEGFISHVVGIDNELCSPDGFALINEWHDIPADEEAAGAALQAKLVAAVAAGNVWVAFPNYFWRGFSENSGPCILIRKQGSHLIFKYGEHYDGTAGGNSGILPESVTSRLPKRVAQLIDRFARKKRKKAIGKQSKKGPFTRG